MADPTFPIGYGTTRVTWDQLIARFEPRMHPAFTHRLFPWIRSYEGFMGIGSGFRFTQPTGPGFAPSGQTFHMFQEFTGQGRYYAAVDLVVFRDGGMNHRAPRWHEVPYQGEDEARVWGVHCNVGGPSGEYDGNVAYKGEPWHMQPIELDGWRRWNTAGRPGLQVDYPIPGVFVPETPPPAAAPPVVVPPVVVPVVVVPPKPVPSPGGNVTVNPAYLKVGAADVNWTEKLQAILPTFGQNVGGIDGRYGPRTKHGIEQVQGFFGLFVDGECGPKTWSVILGIAP